MKFEIVRESNNGGKVKVWEFVLVTGANQTERFRLELVGYTEYKKSKPPEGYRVINRWTPGWNSTMPWSSLCVPADVLQEVREMIVGKATYMKVAAENNPVPVTWNEQQ